MSTDLAVRERRYPEGSRVAVRRRLPDGSATDVVGRLLTGGTPPDPLVVAPDDGPPITLERVDLVAVRVVPPRKVVARSSPDDLERLALRGWPGVRNVRIGGWVVRLSHGGSSRANSVLALGDPGVPLPDAVDRAARICREAGLVPVVQVVPGRADPALDALLEERGWELRTPTCLMTAALPLPPAPTPVGTPPELTLTWSPRPDADHLALLGRAADHPRIVEAETVPADYLTARWTHAGGAVEPVGVARLVRTDDWAGLSTLEVAPRWRGRGLGRLLSRAALDRAAADGARWVYLQVLADNAPALALYGSLGFARHHDYHYRVCPDAETALTTD